MSERRFAPEAAVPFSLTQKTQRAPGEPDRLSSAYRRRL
jgi:hypothetical protein